VHLLAVVCTTPHGIATADDCPLARQFERGRDHAQKTVWFNPSIRDYSAKCGDDKSGPACPLLACALVDLADWLDTSVGLFTLRSPFKPRAMLFPSRMMNISATAIPRTGDQILPSRPFGPILFVILLLHFIQMCRCVLTADRTKHCWRQASVKWH
jgi:hypothetical protein